MGALIAASIFAFGLAYLADRRRRVYADLGTIPAAAVYAGRNEVKGRAWHPDPTIAHHSRTPCIQWSYELEEQRKHTRTTDDGTETYYRWHTIETSSDDRPHLELVDESGTIRVILARASVSTRTIFSEQFRIEDDRGFFEKLFSPGRNHTGKYRHTETGIAVGDDIYVVGEASLRDDVIEPQIAHGSPFVVSTRSEDSHRGWLGLAGFACTAAGVGLALAAGRSSPDPDVGVIIAAIASGLAVVSVTLVSLYNRIQHQVQQAARAWSLIDIQLTRRHDLIPRLATVARAASDHERVVLESVMAARTSLHGEAPTAATIADADREAREQTTRLRRLLAVIEDHPTLGSDAAYLALQREIADAESRIAGTRVFYNDAVTLVRTQRSTFPGLLVARFADRRRFALFEADGFERTVPPVTIDFDGVSG